MCVYVSIECNTILRCPTPVCVVFGSRVFKGHYNHNRVIIYTHLIRDL